MADRAFIILKQVSTTPSLASCAQCQQKFFTPNIYYNDPAGAEKYLLEKFNLHDCFGARERTGTVRGKVW
jgi:hypothetical protein